MRVPISCSIVFIVDQECTLVGSFPLAQVLTEWDVSIFKGMSQLVLAWTVNYPWQMQRMGLSLALVSQKQQSLIWVRNESTSEQMAHLANVVQPGRPSN